MSASACFYAFRLISHKAGLKVAEENFSELANVYYEIKDTKLCGQYETSENTSPLELQPIPSMEALMLKNKDIYAWLNVEGTIMDYPVMFTPGNPEYYLRRNFDEQHSIAGTPFFDGRFTEEADNYIIYGHNMKNGAMFADLTRYSDDTYFKDYSVIRLTTLYEEREYEVIAAFYSELHIFRNTFPWYEYLSFEEEEVFLEFVSHLEKESLFPLPVTLSYGEQFITLVTCSYHDSTGRFVVIGREVQTVDDHEVTFSTLTTDNSGDAIPQQEEVLIISGGIQPDFTAPGYTIHVVQPGDTFFSLSQQYYNTNARWKDIMNYNGMTQELHLKAGEKIRIPN